MIGNSTINYTDFKMNFDRQHIQLEISMGDNLLLGAHIVLVSVEYSPSNGFNNENAPC